MKKNNIPVRHRAYNPNKGYSYAQHKGRLLFMTIMMLLGIVSLLHMLDDPTSSMGMGARRCLHSFIRSPYRHR